MNLRISNLSAQRDVKISATQSAQLFDGIELSTVTDSTLTLIPKLCLSQSPQIEGTLKLNGGQSTMTLKTDVTRKQVIISRQCGDSIKVPFGHNVAIEWDRGIRYS